MRLTNMQENTLKTSFRPQQGLSIMNRKALTNDLNALMFPSPTGVKYYESNYNNV